MISRVVSRVWQLTSLMLAIACAYLFFQNRSLSRSHTSSIHVGGASPPSKAAPRVPAGQAHPDPPQGGASPIEWAYFIAPIAPQPGEPLMEYRNRVLPLVREVLGPQRTRVQALRSDVAGSARLEKAQLTLLDTVVGEAGEAIKDRIMQGILSGELMPRNLKPATGVAAARDVLELADQANRKFRAALRPEQLTALDASRFDVAEYLLFSTRWEDMLGVTE
jgi:hypothetical protein